jgi:hypothetical protein
VYAWIWRQLPFGLPGKLTGSLLLAGAATALLWFLVFPWLDPFVEQSVLPWNEGQLEGDFGPTGGEPGLPAGPTTTPGVPETVGPDGETLENEHDIPYETDE